MLAGRTAFTNSQGKAELEYPTNVSASGNLQIKDENIEGSIGDFFNYSDTESTSITSDAEINVEMIPNVEWDDSYYDNVIDFMIKMYFHKTLTPGEYPEDYPILIDENQSEMPETFYQTAVAEAIQHINDTMGWEVYKTTTNDDARYIFDYSRTSSVTVPGPQVNKNGVWYISDATIYIRNNAPQSELESLKGTIIHEIFTHGLGWNYHSEDSRDISFIPNHYRIDQKISENEKNSKEIYLKLHGGTDLSKHEIN